MVFKAPPVVKKKKKEVQKITANQPNEEEDEEEEVRSRQSYLYKVGKYKFSLFNPKNVNFTKEAFPPFFPVLQSAVETHSPSKS